MQSHVTIAVGRCRFRGSVTSPSSRACYDYYLDASTATLKAYRLCGFTGITQGLTQPPFGMKNETLKIHVLITITRNRNSPARLLVLLLNCETKHYSAFFPPPPTPPGMPSPHLITCNLTTRTIHRQKYILPHCKGLYRRATAWS